MAKKTSDFVYDPPKLYVPGGNKEKAIICPATEWDRVMSRIRKLTSHSKTYESTGWGLIGLASGCFFTFISLIASASFSHVDNANRPHISMIPTSLAVLSLAGAIGFAISGQANLSMARREDELLSVSAMQIHDDLELIKNRCDISPTEEPLTEPPSPPSLPIATQS